MASEAPHYEVRLHAQVREEPSWEKLSFVLLALWRHTNGHNEWCLDYIDAMHGPVGDDDSFDSEEAALTVERALRGPPLRLEDANSPSDGSLGR